MLGKPVFLLMHLGMVKGFGTPARIVKCERLQLFQHFDFGADWPAFD